MKTTQNKPQGILKFLDFRSEVGQVVIAQAQPASTEEDWCPPMKQASLPPTKPKKSNETLADVGRHFKWCSMQATRMPEEFFFCIKCQLFFCTTKDTVF